MQPDDSVFAEKSGGSTGKSQQPPKRVFISYAREDHAFAHRLYSDLKSRGVSAWMDKADLLPGENWKEATRRAIRHSAYVLALLSPRAVSKRGYVQSEFRFALEILKEVPRTEIFLIPVLLEVCEPTDELFNELHWADFTSSYDAGLSQLLRVLAPPTTVTDGAAHVPYKVWYRDPIEDQRITLGRELARGGQARIYEIAGAAHSVAKIYHPSVVAPAEKLELMIVGPPKDPAATDRHISIAWAQAVIKDRKGDTIGYEMPRIDGRGLIRDLYNPKSRATNFPDFTWKEMHRTAANLAQVVSAIHERGYVIGDVNESNVVVHSNALVTVLDTDSFQIPNPRGGVFPCTVGKAEFSAPEIQDQDLTSLVRTQEQDRFAVAVLFYLLLMEGTHPFSGTGGPPLLSDRIKQGLFPYARKVTQNVAPPPSAPSFDGLHTALQECFMTCFTAGHRMPRIRPDLETWAAALKEAEGALVQCVKNERHYYSGSEPACTWCERVRQLNESDLFPSYKPPEVEIEFAENPEPRCPCVLLLDTSEAMAGPAMTALNSGLGTLQDDLRRDSLASRRVEVAVVTFGDGVSTVQEFATVDQFRLPLLHAKGPSLMGLGIHRALDLIEERKTTYRQNGVEYYRPWVLLMAKGQPSDDIESAAARIRRAEASRSLSFITLAAGGDTGLGGLKDLTRRPVVRIDEVSMRDLFTWLSASRQFDSASQPDAMVQLPPVRWGLEP